MGGSDVGGPSWLAGILAAIMFAAAAYCASRVVIARGHQRAAERGADLVLTVMGVAMAGMLVRWLNPLPDRLWAGMFAGGMAWFGWQAWRGHRTAAPERGRAPHRHPLPHLVMCGAMVYMPLAAHAATPGPGTGLAMGGSAGGGHFPLLALVLAVFMVGYVMWQADRLPALARAATGRPGSPAPATTLAPSTTAVAGTPPQPAVSTPDPPARAAARVLSPGLAACCQIAMGLTMGYMLILML